MPDICENCALRLFNDKGHNLAGVGNAIYGNMIIIPNVDKYAYKKQDMTFSKTVEVVNNMLNASTGVIATDYFYITPLIKCREVNNFSVTEYEIKNCVNHLNNEIVRYNIRTIFIMGKVSNRLFNLGINDLFDKVYVSGRYLISGTYNPLISFFDEQKGTECTNHLIKWYNALINKNFIGYEIIKR